MREDCETIVSGTENIAWHLLRRHWNVHFGPICHLFRSSILILCFKQLTRRGGRGLVNGRAIEHKLQSLINRNLKVARSHSIIHFFHELSRFTVAWLPLEPAISPSSCLLNCSNSTPCPGFAIFLAPLIALSASLFSRFICFFFFRLSLRNSESGPCSTRPG